MSGRKPDERRDPMKGEHGKLLLLPMIEPYYEAGIAGWKDYLHLRAQNDRVPFSARLHGGMLTECIAFHLEKTMAPVLDSGDFGHKKVLGLDLYIAKERAGYDGALAVKINSTDSGFRLRDPKTDFAALRWNQQPYEVGLFGVIQDPLPGSDGIGTWVTAAYCADETLAVEPALAFSCQTGEKVLWHEVVDSKKAIETHEFLGKHRREYERQIRALRRRRADEA